MSLRVLSLLLVLGVAVVGCTPDSTNDTGTAGTGFQKEGTLAFYHPDGDTLTTVDVEIADTDAERQQGLMRRRSLGYDRGMLFIFDEVDDSGMWMKNTPLPLDIVFVAPDSQVINIVRRTTPFSRKHINPSAPKKFVVEVRAGFADRYGLTDSARVRWVRSPATQP